MGAKQVTKKKYLKILNKRLRAEPDVSFGALFIFYPLGAKAKRATGIIASELCGQRELAIMAGIQRQAASEFVVMDVGYVAGNG
ncbi:hypothetical protein CJO81_03135 [Ralstonia solanacearum]|uniref:hypothetical protein n=1 Tax=Ralstonia pseudosolanacearum TaxID=1310165 RepID=UPI000E57D8B4|nr:hypothetical protein [Ralstonia pseudosolanacearum]AXW02596.1 hypothetical protein CJO81_03135 [Ralstonia solanacearum]AXW30084.1 hypothetical protein CJO87_03130 [Ralstonia solanacearum]NJZ70797.1 hypothetical protein [Ralstonia solanacearum]NKF82218.1 hypothetical protein [Ralstonia solanacearum]UYR08496.1 hypothetical protein NQS38_00675 [Ralstonia pseudosolanacearum]